MRLDRLLGPGRFAGAHLLQSISRPASLLPLPCLVALRRGERGRRAHFLTPPAPLLRLRFRGHEPPPSRYRTTAPCDVACQGGSKAESARLHGLLSTREIPPGSWRIWRAFVRK